MFEFWHDLLNDKTTFIVSVIVPIVIFLILYALVKMVKYEDVERLRSDLESHQTAIDIFEVEVRKNKERLKKIEEELEKRQN